MLIISLAMVVGKSLAEGLLSRNGACGGTERVLWMGLGQVEVKRLRNYRLHSSKQKRKETDNLPRRAMEREKMHTYMG